MTFDDWLDRGSKLSITRRWQSAKWRLWGQWPILAMEAGWNARAACERLSRLRDKTFMAEYDQGLHRLSAEDEAALQRSELEFRRRLRAKIWPQKAEEKPCAGP